jgi:hypothetical protein
MFTKRSAWKSSVFDGCGCAKNQQDYRSLESVPCGRTQLNKTPNPE